MYIILWCGHSVALRALGQDFSCSVSILAVLAKESGQWWGTSDCLDQLQGATFYTDLLGDA